MVENNDGTPRIMTVAHLQQVLAEITSGTRGDLEVWLSCDEEGNEFLPMFEDQELCLAIDEQAKRIIFFPSHR